MIFLKIAKQQKWITPNENSRYNNAVRSAACRFLTIKLRSCCRNAVKTNTKQERHAPGGSTIIFIKKQQHSITSSERRWTHSVTWSHPFWGELGQNLPSLHVFTHSQISRPSTLRHHIPWRSDDGGYTTRVDLRSVTYPSPRIILLPYYHMIILT